MIDLQGIAVGDRILLVSGITAEVLAIVNDEWLNVRPFEKPDGTPGPEELCHATDIVKVL